MGDTDGAQGKLESYVELDEPGDEPVKGSGYDASSEPTAAVDLDELEPVDEPSWSEGEEKTQHVDLDELEDVDDERAAGGWSDQPIKTEAVDLDDLEVLEKLDPKEANAPPALPDVGERSDAPHAPLPTRRKAAAKKAAPKKKPAERPRSAPPPPPRPPTRQEALKEAPKPMIGGDGWVPEGRISVVDFSAVLSAPPPPRTDEPTEKVAMGAPIAAPASPRPEQERGSGIGKMLLVLLLLAAVGGGAYYLGQQGAGNESVAEAETSGSPSREDFDSAWGESESEAEAEAEAEAESEAESESESESEAGSESAPVPAATTMREPTRTAQRETSTMSAMRATMAAAAREPSTMETAPTETAMEAAPTETAMEAEPSELPAHPSREQVQAALNSVKPAVAACMEGEHATVRVRVTVRGSGRITTAVVQDSLYARPPIGSCIARAVRNARFPQFSEESFVVLYPFQI